MRVPMARTAPYDQEIQIQKTRYDIFELESEERRADKSRTVERVEHNDSGDPGHGHVVVITD